MGTSRHQKAKQRIRLNPPREGCGCTRLHKSFAISTLLAFVHADLKEVSPRKLPLNPTPVLFYPISRDPLLTATRKARVAPCSGINPGWV